MARSSLALFMTDLTTQRTTQKGAPSTKPSSFAGADPVFTVNTPSINIDAHVTRKAATGE
jgi:hypothetical protein